MRKIFFYFLFLLLLVVPHTIVQADLATDLAGRILLQVEGNGEAWYVWPEDDRRYYLGRPDDAFAIMREKGLGVAHGELSSYIDAGFPRRLSGWIALDVEANGEAYYVYPENLKGYYLGRPADAFQVMRELGLGISNNDLDRITVGEEVDDLVNVDIVGVVDTGQGVCFDDIGQIDCPGADEEYYGQDAQYQSMAANYTDNGDGTVTDNNTGLMWVKEAGVKMEYYDATSQADGFTYAGYNDWRVPTIKELYSLIDFSGQDIDPTSTVGGNPFIDDAVFDFEYGDLASGDRIIDSQWVTSSIYKSKVMNNQECFFGVNFADGRIKCYPTSSHKTYFARFVRGGDSYGENSFVDNGDDTITDNSTGLSWSEGDSGQGLDWSSALAFCDDLDLGGHDDWRLPNTKELQGIVDYERSPDTTASPALDPVFEYSTINVKGKSDYPYYWTSTTHKNAAGGAHAVYIGFGRCWGYMNGQYMDVHGAGCQRSDPKSGDASDYPSWGNGPQGDDNRVYNYVRCVRGGAEIATETDRAPVNISTNAEEDEDPSRPLPPVEAQEVCSSKSVGDNCSFQGSKGTVSGLCADISGALACRPK